MSLFTNYYKDDIWRYSIDIQLQTKYILYIELSNHLKKLRIYYSKNQFGEKQRPKWVILGNFNNDINAWFSPC